MNKLKAIQFIADLPDDIEVDILIADRYISSKEVEKLGISRQLLGYHVKLGDVKTVPNGRQKKYLLNDILKIKG